MRLTIAKKFLAVVAMLVPLIVAVAVAGEAGLSSMKSEFDVVFADNVHTSQVSTTLGAALARADDIALRVASASDPGERQRLFGILDRTVVPAVDSGLRTLEALHARDPASERIKIQQLADGWTRFVALRDTGAMSFDRTVSAGPRGSDPLTDQIAAIFEPFAAIIQSQANLEQMQAGSAYAHARQTYDSSRLIMWTITIGACLLGVGSMLLLTRNVVPRITRYSRFASMVATGDLSVRVASRGSDELATLGRSLNDMIERREFLDSLQVIDSEELAHDLLRRQLERALPGSRVVVLNRNNSNDRLEATTAVREDSSLIESLASAKPRSCMAVLFARPHSEDRDLQPLTRCEVCGKTERKTTCEPLLVGGEVIGSVLVEHAEPLQEQQRAALRDSVSQAAPVLANLRSLALAEIRASTDGLTGLPNQRVVNATVKRMAAQTSRTLSPLSAIMFDLDHFKRINDTLGHARGDDVLAAVGAALPDAVRTSDFVGRSGGEEFIALLPDTNADVARIVAEKIRTAVAGISIPGIDAVVTASLGIATIPDHARDGDQLVRNADRALYLAKANGRNRVETADRGSTGASESATPRHDDVPVA